VSWSEPPWARWEGDPDRPEFTLGLEEEVMLLTPGSWVLAQSVDEVLLELSPPLAEHVTSETHRAALELGSGIHPTAVAAASELTALRVSLAQELGPLGLRVAAAGTHPFTLWQETRVSDGARYQLLYGSLRELARREPTFALHVHVGVSTADRAVDLLNRLRTHLPLLLALSANSPYWQGRDTGLASTRVPVFQAFPRVGIPRRFRDYHDYIGAVDLLIRSGAFPEATFLWWDIRLQPRFGTVEIRIMDSQTRVQDTAALLALVQSVARLELEEGYASEALIDAPEVLDENRFLAVREGVDAHLIDPESASMVPLRHQLEELLAACGPHAVELGCASELADVAEIARCGGASRQREMARESGSLPGLVGRMSDLFVGQAGAQPSGSQEAAAGLESNAPVPQTQL
jgi:carboxylate-amine ligase